MTPPRKLQLSLPSTRSRGFTLVELSMVLVIIGLTMAGLLEIGLSMMKRAEIKETTSKVALIKDRIVGYALSNQRLPEYASGAGTDQITSLEPNNRDFWGKKLNYIYDPQLVRADLSSVVCAKKTTNLQVRQCTDIACTTPTTQTNVAFVLFSSGRNMINQTGSATIPHTETLPDLSYSGPDGSTAAPKIITIYPNIQVGFWETPSTNPTPNDDIVSIVTIEDLRQRLGCQGTPLRIVNTDLPMGAKNASYSASIYVEGGVPITPATLGKYRWCAESTVTPTSTFTSTGIAVPEAIVGAAATVIPIGAAGSCAAAAENASAWVQGDDFRLRGVGTVPPNSLVSTGAGTYDLTVYVRDDQSVNTVLQSNPDTADNIVSRRFVLAISGS